MLSSVQSIGSTNLYAPKSNIIKKQAQVSSPIAKTELYSKQACHALKANSLNLAKTIKFTGALNSAFEELNQSMQTCKTKDKKGESVGSRANINKLLHDFSGDFAKPDDAIKTTIDLGDSLARTQIKLVGDSQIPESQDLKFEMIARKKPTKDTTITDRSHGFKQQIAITMTPMNYKGQGTAEQAYVLNTKGNLMAVVKDDGNVLLTNAGKINKKDNSSGTLEISTIQGSNVFKPFSTRTPKVQQREQLPSIGKGSEIVIGMEDGRFVNEIKDSIRTFVEKVNNGEIVLQQFVAAPNAADTKLVMLAGGYGSRAEYTNASSSAIFDDEINGSQSTKGVFRTATGLTPMETTFVTLHNAGLLDCSKGVVGFGDGGNIKLYLNKTGSNTGNGGFTIDLYDKMQLAQDKSIMIFPNDSMSRMTQAVINAKQRIDSGEAAMVMIAKKVSAKDAEGTFGIMKLDSDKHILEFAEKPSPIPAGYADSENMCLTNTFQFAVSKEAFKALDILAPYLPDTAWGKESRDWSKVLTPVLMALTSNNDVEKMQEEILKSMKSVKEFKDKNIQPIPLNALQEAKNVLGKQRIYAEPTAEPWADCGTLNQLYHTTMQIVSGDFPLEDFEQANALSCVNTQTGLIASSPEQKAQIESKYDVQGQVMAVQEAKKITNEMVKDIPVTINR